MENITHTLQNVLFKITSYLKKRFLYSLTYVLLQVYLPRLKLTPDQFPHFVLYLDHFKAIFLIYYLHYIRSQTLKKNDKLYEPALNILLVEKHKCVLDGWCCVYEKWTFV